MASKKKRTTKKKSPKKATKKKSASKKAAPKKKGAVKISGASIRADGLSVGDCKLTSRELALMLVRENAGRPGLESALGVLLPDEPKRNQVRDLMHAVVRARTFPSKTEAIVALAPVIGWARGKGFIVNVTVSGGACEVSVGKA